MKKTTVYLEPWLDHNLRLIAEEEGKSKAEVMREALATRVMDAVQPRIKAIGAIEDDGPTDLADNVDRYLEGFGED